MNLPGSGPGHGRVVPMREHPIEEASLGMLYELVGDAVAWIGRDGAVRPISRAMSELLSSVEREIGRPVRYCSDLPFDKDDGDALKLLLESGEARHELILTLRQRGGPRVLRARFCAEALQGGWFAVWHDETRLRRAEAEVQRLNRLRLLGRFASGIAHDFNNVLGALLGLAEHLAAASTDDDEQRFLDRVRASTRDGAAMVQRLSQLLDHAPIDREVVPLQDLIDRVLEFFEKKAILRGIEVGKRFGRDLPRVRVVAADAIAGILHLCLIAFENGKPILISAESDVLDAPRAGLPTRRYGVVRVLDHGDARIHEKLAAACTGAEHAIARHLEGLTEDRVSQVLALLAVQAHGALFRPEPRTDGQRCAGLWFPAARGASQR